MKPVLLCLFILIVMPMGAEAKSTCALRSPGICQNTNQLIWAPGTVPAIKAFLKGETGNFLFRTPKVSAASDLREVLGGAPDDPLPLDDGSILFTACRSHSCPEKGAMAVKDGKIAALAILHMNCGAKDCDADYTLTLYQGRGATAATRQAIEAWAKKSVAEQYVLPGSHKPLLAHINAKAIAR